MKVCQICGAPLPPDCGRSRRFCAECRRNREREMRKGRKTVTKDSGKSIAQIVAEARAAKMSYGEYVSKHK